MFSICGQRRSHCRAFSVLVAITSIVSLSPTALAQSPDLGSWVPITLDSVALSTAGVWSLPGDTQQTIRLYGDQLTDATVLSFSLSPDQCTLVDLFSTTTLYDATGDGSSALADISLPPHQVYHFCLDGMSPSSNATWLVVQTTTVSGPLVPLWAQIILLLFLLVMSGMFSGLNLGLMALDTTGLKIVMKSGTPSQQRNAKTIYPVRIRGNYLLCTILLGNVLVNNTLTTILGGLTSGVAAVIGSTAAIVVFGEIVPQSVCSRHGLWIGAHTIWITKFFMVLTAPASWPISKTLDWVLGKEIGTVYNRDEIKLLLKETRGQHDLADADVNLVEGALDFSSKTVAQVMTPLEAVFMVPIDDCLDLPTMRRIVDSGHSRIPVFETTRNNIVGLLLTRNLTFLDPEHCTPISAVINYYKHPVMTVFDDMHLNEILTEFKKGRTHLAVVHRVNTDGPGDPFYETVGVVSMEDVIEDLIQDEILDETDIRHADGVDGTRIRGEMGAGGTSLARYAHEVDEKPRLSHHLSVAVFSFLSNGSLHLKNEDLVGLVSFLCIFCILLCFMGCVEVGAFNEKLLSKAILRKLVEQSEVLSLDPLTDSESNLQLYVAGRASSVFTLVIEGHCKVVAGRDHFVFEYGPFSTLGEAALLTKEYVPDYDVVVTTKALVLQVKRTHYVAATEAVRVALSPDTRRRRPASDMASESEAQCTTDVPMHPAGGAVVVDLSESEEEADFIDGTTAITPKGGRLRQLLNFRDPTPATLTDIPMTPLLNECEGEDTEV